VRPGRPLSASNLLLSLNVAVFLSLTTVSLLRERGPFHDRESIWEPLTVGFPLQYESEGFGWLSLDDVKTRGEWWRLFNYQFLHANLLHLLFNMLALLKMGPAVELYFGRNRFVLLYLVSGVLAGLASMVGHGWIEHQNSVTVGASGALFGLMGALISFGRKTGSIAGRAFARTVAMNAVAMLVLGFMFPVFDNWAHGGGLVGGVVLGSVLFPSRRAGKSLRRLTLAASLAASLVSVAALGIGCVRVLTQRSSPLKVADLSLHVQNLEILVHQVLTNLPRMDRMDKAAKAMDLSSIRKALADISESDEQCGPWCRQVAEAVDQLAVRLRRASPDQAIQKQCFDVVTLLREPPAEN